MNKENSNQSVLARAKNLSRFAYISHLILTVIIFAAGLYFKNNTLINFYCTLLVVNGLFSITRKNKLRRLSQGIEYVIRPIPILANDLIYWSIAIVLACSGLIFAPLALLLYAACFTMAYVSIDNHP